MELIKIGRLFIPFNSKFSFNGSELFSEEKFLLGLRNSRFNFLADGELEFGEVEFLFEEEERFFSSRRAARDGHAGEFGGQAGIIALSG